MLSKYLMVEKPTRVMTVAWRGQPCLCPHAKPWNKAGVHSPLPTVRFQKAPGRGLTAAKEHRKGSVLSQTPLQREGFHSHPVVSGSQACLTRACWEGQCQLSSSGNIAFSSYKCPVNAHFLEIGKILFSRPIGVK